MESLELIANGEFNLVDKMSPTIKSNQCLIRVRLRCAPADVYRSHDNGAYFYPLVMGHEIAGRVELWWEEQDSFQSERGGGLSSHPLPCEACDETYAVSRLLVPRIPM